MITALIVLLLLPIALPIAALLDIMAVTNAFRRFHGRQQPREQELTKASWGAAILVIGGGLLWFTASAQIQKFIDALRAWPNDLLHAIPAIVFLLVIAWAVLWFLTGTRRALAFGQERDSRLITRAVFKIAAGLAIAYYALGSIKQPYIWPVLAVVAWLVITGLTKFLLVAPGHRKPRPPPPTTSKAPARDATADEALEDMKGHGGRKTSLDDQEF